MFTKLIAFGVLFLLVIAAPAQVRKPALVQQTILYQTGKAKEVSLVWAVNDWKTPDPKCWPAHTVLKEDHFAYTPMTRTPEGFSVSITLPRHTQLDYAFLITQDSLGNSLEVRDNYDGMNYAAHLTNDAVIHVKDTTLHFPTNTPKPFSLLERGWFFLLGTLLLLGLSVGIVKKKQLPILPSKPALLLGLLIALYGGLSLIRLQMNDFLLSQPRYLLGAVFYDFTWLLLISIALGGFILISRKWSRGQTLLGALFLLVLLLTALSSLLNIEVVRVLGSPLTYQWLYYSDFMNAVDAKNAMAKNVTGPLILHIAFLLTSLFLSGISLSYLIRSLGEGKTVIALVVGTVIILGLGHRQHRYSMYQLGKIQNPILSFIASANNKEESTPLFTQPVSARTQHYIQSQHTYNILPDKVGKVPIQNVVLFVMESTPQQFIGLSDTMFGVTPHLNKWKGISRTYKNMYAHIPSTPNSMLSLVSGIYPLISYRSLVNDYPNLATPSLPGTLKKDHWKTSLFFSSDLQYNHMAAYCKNQQFDVTGDYQKMKCNYQNFTLTHTVLDGLDDRCLVNQYFDWADSQPGAKKFSVLWTNQTHYPYFAPVQQVKYVENNPDLNRYLNALHSSDEAFGQLMTRLQERGQLATTLVIVVGDHGEAFGTHNQTTHAAQIYEENVHIPCILFNPVLFQGTSDDRIAGLIDVAPTIAHVTGIAQPREWQGRSLLETAGKKTDERAFFISPYSDFLFGTRHQEWKYIYNASNNSSFLFHLGSDPGELHNLASLHPEIVKQEQEMLAGWIQYHTKQVQQWLPVK